MELPIFLSPKRAVFDIRILPESPEKCKLVFVRTEDHVKIEQHSFPFLCGFERIAYANGNYYDAFVEKEASLPFGDLKEAIFKR